MLRSAGEYGQSAVGDLEHWALRDCVRAASALHAVCAVPRVHLPLPMALSAQEGQTLGREGALHMTVSRWCIGICVRGILLYELVVVVVVLIVPVVLVAVVQVVVVA